MNKIIEELDLSKVKINDSLSFLFENNKLVSEYKNILYNIAILFLSKYESEIPVIINDITITGSMVNYNYNESSDIDLHIIVDKEKNRNFQLLKTEAKIFNLKYEGLNINNNVVELYVQDSNEEHNSTGIYTIMNDKFLLIPKRENVNIPKDLIEKKFNKMVEKIDTLIKNKDNNIITLKKFTDKLKKFRKQGLESDGEFSVENIVFKLLRTEGYITKLHDYIKTLEIKNVLK